MGDLVANTLSRTVTTTAGIGEREFRLKPWTQYELVRGPTSHEGSWRRASPANRLATARTRPNRGPLTTHGGRESIPTSSQLAQLAAATEGAPFEKWAHYFEVYDEVLGELARQCREGARDKPVRVLEIGVWRGGSLKLWRDYFGKNAVIYGIDVDPECAHLGVSDAEVRIGSQADPHSSVQSWQRWVALT